MQPELHLGLNSLARPHRRAFEQRSLRIEHQTSVVELQDSASLD